MKIEGKKQNKNRLENTFKKFKGMRPQWLPQKITGSILSTGKHGEEKVGKHKWPQNL